MFLAETFFSRIQPDRTVDFDVFRVSPPSPCWTPTNSITCFRRTTHFQSAFPLRRTPTCWTRSKRSSEYYCTRYGDEPRLRGIIGGGGRNVVRNDVKLCFVIFFLCPDGLVGRIASPGQFLTAVRLPARCTPTNGEQ